VVTSIDPAGQVADHYIETPEQLVNVLRTLVDVVLPEGVAVLNADDPLVAPLAPLCDGEVIFFSSGPDNPVVTRHRAHGRRAVLFRGGRLILASGQQEILVTAPAATAAIARDPEMAAIIAAAAAAAWAMAVAPDLIRAGIETHHAGAMAELDRKAQD
jgi:cyanophycin synthetase